MIDTAELRKAVEKIGPEEWHLNTGVSTCKQSKKDVEKLGWYVFQSMWGAIAATPKDSPQFSRHDVLMRYIATFDPATVLGLLDRVDQLEQTSENEQDDKTKRHPLDHSGPCV